MSQHMPAVAMVLGASSEFFWKSKEALAKAGVVAVEASLADVASAVLRWRPHVLLLTEDVYAFDPPRLDALAEGVGAVIVIVESEAEPFGRIERRFAAALATARRNRRARAERTTIPAPSPSSNLPPRSAQPTSGVREVLPATLRPHQLRVARRG